MFDDAKGGGEKSRRDDDSGDAFIARISRPLRKGEKVDETFELRVMSGVHASDMEPRYAGTPFGRGDETLRPGGRPNRWKNPRVLTFGLATAAAIAAVVTAAILGVQRENPPGEMAAGTAPGPQVVSFSLRAPDAQSVILVGAFNSWSKGATRLTNSDGVWTVSIPLPPGRHEYAFIVNDAAGERWVADPAALTMRDEFGTESSVLTVGDVRAGRTTGSAS